MNMHSIIDAENFILIKNDQPVTTSIKVAEAFGKRHANVLRDLQSLECSGEFNELNFEFIEYLDSRGRMKPAYEMTKNGFMFLVMGFTGAKAAAIKEAYIKAFDVMADLLLEQQEEDEGQLGSFVGESVELDFGRAVVYADWCDKGNLWLADWEIDKLLGYKLRKASRTLFFRRQNEFPLDSYEIFEDQGVTTVMFTPRAWAVIARFSANPRAGELSLAAVQYYVTPGRIEVDKERYHRAVENTRIVASAVQGIRAASGMLAIDIDRIYDPAVFAADHAEKSAEPAQKRGQSLPKKDQD